MTDLPTKGDLIDTDATEVEFQNAMSDLYDFVAELCVSNSNPEALTIASGSVTPTRGFVIIDTESAAATDDLANISASTLGSKMLFVKATSGSRVITLKHLAGGSGQLYLSAAADLVLDDPTKMVAFMYNTSSSRWEQAWKNWGIYAPLTADRTAIRSLLSLGTAALVNTGSGSSDVPLNSNLGALAYLSALTNAAQITDGIITNAKIANATIALSKMANGTPNTLMGFNASGIATTVAQQTIPDLGLSEYFESPLRTYANGTAYTYDHGMSVAPKLAMFTLVANTGDYEYPFTSVVAANSGGRYAWFSPTQYGYTMQVNTYGTAGLPNNNAAYKIRVRLWG